MFAVIAVFVLAIVALGQPGDPSDEEKDTRANLLEFGEEADVETPPWANVRDHRNTLNTISGTWSNQGPGPSIYGQIENVGPVDSATGFNRNEVSGAAHAVIAHPTNADILYVGGTNGGVWKTTNATTASPTWTPLTDGMPSNSIGALAFDPTDSAYNTVWAGIGNFSSYSRAGGLRTGLITTTDAGSNWSVVNGGGSLNGKNISGLVVRGDTIIIAVNNADSFIYDNVGIFRSTDGGSSFTQMSVATGSGATGLPGGLSYDLASNPNAPAVLYTVMNFADGAGGTNGIYRSADTGATWSKVSTAEMDALIISGGDSGTSNVEIAVGNGGSVFVAIINSGQLRNGGIFYSGTGNAGSFTKMDTVLVNEAGGSVGTNPRFKPNDGEPGGQGAVHFSIAVDPSNDQIVYIGGDRQPAGYQDSGGFPNSIGALDYSGRLFRGNAGVAATGAVPSPQWEHLTHTQGAGGMTGGGTASGSSPHADSREMTFDANGNLIETDDGGIYRRTSPGDNTGDWVSIIGTLQTTEQHDVAYDPISNIIMSGNQDTGSTQQSSTGSKEWVSILTADGGDIAIGIDPSNPNQSVRYSSFQYLGAFRRQVYNSANQLVGDGFPPLTVLGGAEPMTPNFLNPVEINAIETNRLIFGASNGIYESANQGTSISKLTSGTISSSYGGNVMVYGGRRNDADNPDFIFAALAWTAADETAYKKVIIRTSAGGSFTEYLTPADTSLRGVTADPEDWNRLFIIDRNQVFMSTDAGANWIDITGNLPDGFTTTDLRVLDFVRAGDRGALLVGGINGVYAALDDTNYTSWAKLGTDLPIVPVWDLDYDATDNVLVAGTLGRGSWKMINVSQSLFNTAVPEYTVTPSAGANGSIEPSTVVTVEQGSSYSFTITPDAGYETITPVGGTCGGTLVDTTYTTATITASCSVTATFEVIPTEVSLADALDAPQLDWTTNGDTSWFGQTSTTYDGVDAAQSGDISDNEVSRLITSVEGPGTLSFVWKVASEAFYDQLIIYIDDEPQDTISGNQDWVDVQLDIAGSGEHSIVWSYEKDFSVSLLEDAAWVDLVSWEAAQAPSEPTLNAVTTLQTSVTQASATLEFTQGVGGPSADSFTASCEPIVEGSEARVQSATTESAESNPEEASYQRPRIVGGELASDGEFPFLVTVLPSGNLCGGSIISDRWVVTAAHCLEGLTASDVSIRAGSNQLFSGYTTYQAENIYLHPAYDNWTFDNDIALIQVSTAITAAKTASIDFLRGSNESSLLSDFDEVVVAGWGTTSSGGTTSSNLLKVSVDVQFPSTCRANTDYDPSEITDNMICAGVMGGGKDSCQGDSGGPLVRYDGTGNPWLTGIVSWGYGCADAGYPGVYTRVANYADWITEKLVLSETGTSSPITVNGLTAGTFYRCSVAAFAGPASSSSGMLTILAGDSDGDGVLDYDDAFPNDPTETTDTDGEGLGDNLEGTLGTDINNPDTDGDGYTDYEEYVDGTDPLDDGDPGFGGLPVWLLIQAIQ